MCASDSEVDVFHSDDEGPANRSSSDSPVDDLDTTSVPPKQDNYRRAEVAFGRMSLEYTVDSLLPLGVDELLQLCDDGHIDAEDISSVLHRRVLDMVGSFDLPAGRFLQMLDLSECVVSGSSVLAVLFPGAFSPGDIDVYVAENFKGSVMGFLSRYGYSQVKLVYPWIQRGDVGTLSPPSQSILPFVSPSPFMPLPPSHQGVPPFSSFVRATLNKGSIEEISEVYELINGSGQKVNVIVSVGKAVLPILRFHSTVVMNYIAHHGIVILHRLTLARLGIKNHPPESITNRTRRCYAKYERRGFRILDRALDGHTCGRDSDCLQTSRSLFDEHVEHFRFPSHLDESPCDLRLGEARLMRWRSAAATSCVTVSEEKLFDL